MTFVKPIFHRLHVQSGMALLALIGVIALLAAMLFVTYLNNGQIRIERDKKTQQALSIAKQALIGWTLTRADPGQLPCPEDTSKIGLATEGEALSSCTLPAIGRLPWKTLKLGDLRDGDGEKLWYVVSPGFRVSPINSTTLGQLTVNTTNTAAAIVISPGAALNGQIRTSPTAASPPNVTQYLELTNSDGDTSFVTGTRTTTFNDQMLLISQVDIFNQVIPVVLSKIRGDTSEGLINYYLSLATTVPNTYPYADSADTDLVADTTLLTGFPSADGYPDSLSFSVATKNTLVDNNWLALINYTVTADQQQVTLTLGSKTMIVHP